ncbi:MAG: mannonate dehydratase [Paracoccaceae bacterium]|nr:mannonate dehydratase [Paracoccaceae bacterium]
MRQLWRWFGPADGVSLSDARQAGAEGIVTALHHVPTGDVWTPEAIAERQRDVAFLEDGRSSGLAWELVESLPVSEAIKTRSGDWSGDIERYCQSLENISDAGINTVCYNFMPVLDWTRTDLAAPMAHGGTAMRFDLVVFAAFDLHILGRSGAVSDYDGAIVREANARIRTLDTIERSKLAENISAGLPGAEEHWSLGSLRDRLEDYAGLGRDQLFQNHVAFLEAVAPVAERVGVRLCCHPDDPPFPLLGLPRVVSTADDYRALFDAVPSPAVGITFCTGSLGVRPDNDLPAMAREFGPRLFFAHLRNVSRDRNRIPCSFFEDEHLEGDTDMVTVIDVLLAEERRRAAVGCPDFEIPMRPDHGQDILSDSGSGSQPGYPAVGRLKGLAELRGVMRALQAVDARRSGV